MWCRHQESNSGPADYKSAALPRLSYSGFNVMVDQNEARMLQKKDDRFNNSRTMSF